LADVGKGGFQAQPNRGQGDHKFGLTLFAVAQKSAASSHDHCARPLRVSLGGGGTDLPSYYRDHTGFPVAAAIDKYVYIILNQRSSRVSCSSIPHGGSFFVDAIQHPIIRESLKALGIKLAAT